MSKFVPTKFNNEFLWSCIFFGPDDIDTTKEDTNKETQSREQKQLGIQADIFTITFIKTTNYNVGSIIPLQ